MLGSGSIVSEHGNRCVHGNFGVKTHDGTTKNIVINGGKVSSDDETYAGTDGNYDLREAIKLYNGGIAEINGGEISGIIAGVSVIGSDNYGLLRITGGTFSSKGSTIAYTSSAILSGNPVSVGTKVNAEITGGSFSKSPSAYVSYPYNVAGPADGWYTVAKMDITLTHVEAKAATCTEAGNIEYWYDAANGIYFSDADATKVIAEADTVLAKLAHTPGEAVVENEHPATHLAPGSYDSVVYCTVCEEEISRTPVNVPATGEHTAGTPAEENRIDPTCTEDGGYDTVVRCTEDDTILSSEHVVLPALGHAYGEPVWAEDYATATFTCERDDDAQTVDATITSEVTTEPTYISAGVRTYTASVTFEGKDYTATVRTEPIPMPIDDSGSGDDYVAPSGGGGSTAAPAEETVSIEDEETPLAALPDDYDAVTVTIGDEEVPLADVPLVYSDVALESWSRDAIAYVTAIGVMNGTGDGEFSPAATTTGDMLAAMVYRLSGGETTEGEGWAESGLAWLEDSGYADGTGFDASAAATREQLVAILYRKAEDDGYNVAARSDLSAFEDAESLSAYAEDAMAWAVSVGLIQGYGDDTLRPGAEITREQIATIFLRYALLLGK